MQASAITDRIVSLIEGAPLDCEPTENIYLESVFEPAVYDEILTRLPSDAAMDNIDHPDAQMPGGRVTRRLLDLTEETLPRIALKDRAFWRTMRAAWTSPALLAALQHKFRATIDRRFSGDPPDMVLTPMFLRDEPGYFISIHPDSPKKVATMQFYFPLDDSQRHLGTTFHRRDGETYTEVKTNAFVPNAAYAFARTEESWHSVKPIGEGERTRNTLALIMFIKGEEYRAPVRAA